MSLRHEDVLRILALLDASNFDELRLETSDYKLHVRRGGASAAAAGADDSTASTPRQTPAPTRVESETSAQRGSSTQTPEQALARPGTASPARRTPDAPSAAAAAAAARAVADARAAADADSRSARHTDLVDVTAPLLGTFYASPQPGAPPFVAAGSEVDEDTVIGIVEVMKLMNSVCAGTRGVVTELVARDGQLVEFGEVLLRIAPAAA